MATTDDRQDLSVAPIVGPDDPRRFTDSGIEVKQLYDETDLPEQLGAPLREHRPCRGHRQRPRRLDLRGERVDRGQVTDAHRRTA